MENEGAPFKRIKQSFCLPEEIMEEILSRLPVKSLLKFRCVSKPWRSLIGTERFIKKHLHTSTENPNFAHHIILKSFGPQRRLKQCSLLSVLNDPLTRQITPWDLENINLESISIVGCCNGLVCLLLDGKHFMLGNPSLRKTKKLPAFDHNNEKCCFDNYGFGYDDLSGDYIVFGACSFGNNYTVSKVYSLHTNSWKKVMSRRSFTLFYETYEMGVFASGKMHWSTLGKDWNIVSFDLRSEVYDVIDLPWSSCGGYFCKSIGLLRGRLSLPCHHRFGKLDIWVIKEYGVKVSWEKVLTFPYHDIITTPRILYPFQFAIGPNGEILLTSASSFKIVHPEGNGFRHCRVRDHCSSREAVVHVESLVPL